MEGEHKYDEQHDEVEALSCIFIDEFKLHDERPYRFDVTINANQESDEKNFLKVKLVVELPPNYPDEAPSIRLKNLV